ncbi:MAG: NADPH-dependent oxidoreductase [Clostridia bacterium]|nr:NADPH-dependent oxidoreductase [Clostridia bacterium]
MLQPESLEDAYKMKITVIYGNMRHGSTWHCTQEILQQLMHLDVVEVTEFSLPRDLPQFCNGCFCCIYKGEETCPHRSYTRPIEEALIAADLIILASPVYGLDVSGAMKTLIDHLCFQWMSHRPHPAMFKKIGLTVTTSAGAGLGHTTKTLKNSLVFWGVQNVVTFKYPVSAMKWDDVSAKNQAKIRRRARTLASRIARVAKAPRRLRNPLFRSFFFSLMRGMQQKNDWNPLDRAHWEKLGWLSGHKPF